MNDKPKNFAAVPWMPGVEIVIDPDTAKFLGLEPPSKPWKMKPRKVSDKNKKKWLRRITF